MPNGFDPNTPAYIKQVINNHGGLQRTNRFMVELFPPAAVRLPKQEIPCQDVIFPEKSLNVVADALSGPTLGRVVPKGLAYANGVGLVFPTFNDWAVEEFFQDWQNYIFSRDGNGNWITQYYDIAVKPAFMRVRTYDVAGNETCVHTFSEIQPINIQPNSQFSMRASDRPLNSNFYIMSFYTWDIKPTKK